MPVYELRAESARGPAVGRRQEWLTRLRCEAVGMIEAGSCLIHCRRGFGRMRTRSIFTGLLALQWPKQDVPLPIEIANLL